MKLAPRAVEEFLRRPDPAVRAALIYGPDRGLVRERADALIRTVAGDAGDPFRVVTLSPAELRGDPARLADEAASLSFTGGRRVVHLREADEAVAGALGELLAGDAGGALVVAEAGDLPSRSALRRLFEGAARGMAVPCYLDDERELPALIGELLREAGLEAAPDAIAFLAANLGADRQLTRREIEKLALYKGPAGGRVDLADAQACVGDSAALSLEDLAFAVAEGTLAEVERALSRSLQEGVTPVRALRTVARHFERLHLTASLLARGEGIEQALRRLRPPPFWKVAARFRAQAASWPPAALGRAIVRLLEAEQACKRTGAPDEALCAQALLEIARMAPRSGTRRSA